MITLCVHDIEFKACEECNPARRNGHDVRKDPKPGDCEMCGEWAGKLIDGTCSACNEFYQLGLPF